MKTINRFILLFTCLVLASSIQVNALTINGLVYNVKEKVPQANHSVYFVTPGSVDTLGTQTNSDGLFTMDMQFDSADSIYVQIMTLDPCTGSFLFSFIYPFTSSNYVEFKVCNDSTGGTDCQARFEYYAGSWVDSSYTGDGDFVNTFSTVYFFDQSLGNITNWYWDFGDGSSSNEQNPVHTYAGSGEYWVTLTILGSECKSLIQNQVWVGYAEPACTAWFYYDFGYSADSISYLNDSISDNMLTVYFHDYSIGSPTNWIWDFGDGFSSEEQNPVHTYTSPGEYIVYLYITGENCENGYKTSIWVGNYEPPCQAMFGYDYNKWDNGANSGSDSTGTIDYNTLYFYDYSSGSPNSWKWDFGDGESSTDQNPWHTFTIAGEYLVSLEIANETCSSNYSMYVYTGSYIGDTIWVPENCQAYFYPIIETNNKVSFINQSYGSIIDNIWDFGDGTTSNEVNPIHEYANQGEYIVTLAVNTLDNCASKIEMFVTVGDYSYISDSVLTALFIPEINGNSVTFHDKSVGKIDNRYWDFGDGESSIEKDPIHIYSELKTYFVTLGISNSLAVRTFTIELNLVEGTFKGYFANEDGLGVVSYRNGSELNVHPNPIIDKLTISFNSLQPVEGELTLINLGGQVVAEKPVMIKSGPNTFELNTEFLEKGLYLLQIKGNRQLFKTIKVVK
jgi:PKD repeat protein